MKNMNISQQSKMYEKVWWYHLNEKSNWLIGWVRKDGSERYQQSAASFLPSQWSPIASMTRAWSPWHSTTTAKKLSNCWADFWTLFVFWRFFKLTPKRKQICGYLVSTEWMVSVIFVSIELLDFVFEPLLLFVDLDVELLLLACTRLGFNSWPCLLSINSELWVITVAILLLWRKLALRAMTTYES